MLKVLYLKNIGTSQNLPIYGVKASSLVNYEKTEVDLKKGIKSREPNDLNRIEEEDLIRMDLDTSIFDLDEDDDSLRI